jgi:uncharacterized delta-60 repeat protein
MASNLVSRIAAVLVALLAGATSVALAGSGPGSLDESFDGDGKLTTAVGLGGADFRDVVVDPEGRTVAVGSADVDPDYDEDHIQNDLLIARFDVDGSPDAEFSGDGFLTVDFGTARDAAFAVAIQPDGAILVAGATLDESDFVVMRVTSEGVPDDSFSEDGVASADFGGPPASARAIALAGDGTIVASGFVGDWPDEATRIGVARYASDGTPLDSFAGDGSLVVDSGPRSRFARDVAVLGDGAIQVGASIGTGGHKPGGELIRLEPDGDLDQEFSGDGRRPVWFKGRHAPLEAMAIQDDGAVVVLAAVRRDHQDTFGFARFAPDGRFDTSFSSDGRRLVRGAFPSALEIQPNGRIVGGGATMTLVRLRPDGRTDGSFGDDGIVRVGFGHDVCEDLGGLALAPERKLVAAGSVTDCDDGINDRAALARVDR